MHFVVNINFNSLDHKRKLISSSQVKAMIAEADIDGDGKINFVEFKSLIANKAL